MKIVKYLIPISLALWFGLVLYLTLIIKPQPTTKLLSYLLPNSTIDSLELWEMIVAYKQQNGLQAPTIDQNICKYAQLRLAQVAFNFSHDEFKKPLKFEITDFNEISENLAKGQSFAGDVFNQWKASPSHNEALVKNHLYACVECANINGTNYCVYLSAI